MRSLIWVGGALGDVLLGLPALHAIARTGAVTAVMGRAAAGLLRGRTPADRVFREDDPRLLPLWGPAPDAALELLGHPTSGLVVTGSAGLAATLGVRHVPLEAPGHRALRLLHRPPDVASLEVPLLSLEPRPCDVLLFPGSGGERKCWSGFEALGHRLARDGRAVQVVLGPDELERGWAARDWGGLTVIAPDLVHTAELCAGARVVVGNDAGTTHLAAVSGATVVALFGPTPVELWRPIGPRVRVLRGVCRGLSVDAVYGVVRST